MRRLSRDSVRYHFPLLIGKFIRGCLCVCVSVVLFEPRQCDVFSRAAIIHRYSWSTCVRMRTRKQPRTGIYTAVRCAIIRYGTIDHGYRC